MKRKIRIYKWYFRKRLIYHIKSISTNKFANIDNNIDDIDKCLNKINKVIDSCIYVEQLDTAERCINVFISRFPFSIVLNKLLNKRILSKRLELPYYYE